MMCQETQELELNRFYNVKVKQYQIDKGIEHGVFGAQLRIQIYNLQAFLAILKPKKVVLRNFTR